MVYKNKSYVPRDVSWRKFNRRVLKQVVNKQFTLLERLNYLKISITNLNEFFSYRVPLHFKKRTWVVDKEIFYEETSRTFFIGWQGNKVTKQSLEEDYSILYGGERYKSFGNPQLFETKEDTTVAGKEITQGFILEDSKYDESYVLIRLDKQFSSIEFDVGKVDDPNEYKIEYAVMKLELDVKEKYKEPIRAQIASEHY